MGSGLFTAQFDRLCERADVIVGGDRGAALLAQRVALPAVVGLVERHLVRDGVKVGVRVGVGVGVGVGVRLRARARVRVIG